VCAGHKRFPALELPTDDGGPEEWLPLGHRVEVGVPLGHAPTLRTGAQKMTDRAPMNRQVPSGPVSQQGLIIHRCCGPGSRPVTKSSVMRC
jgi:hypothetical protein